MNIDLGSFAYGSTLQEGAGTPSWGTSIGQSHPKYYITREGSEVLLIGMIYCSVSLENVSLPLGRGGHTYNCLEAGTIKIASLFNNVYVNNTKIDTPFILVLQREDSGSHAGRLSIKYSDKAVFNNEDVHYSNKEFIKQVYEKFEMSDDACWFVYDISIKNHEDLHLNAIIVNNNNSEEYLNSTNRSEAWKKLIKLSDESYSTDNEVYNADDEAYSEKLENISFQFRPYITAIKSKPFLLLAGISGTGKSRIVRELARACWEKDSEEYKAQKPKNFQMVQVKPNWHDSSDLLGYVSRVSGKAEFVAGDFLKFIAKAWEKIDTPYFLCLDEMNLAPVEQYFAEYLSVIESRKCCEDGTITTDPILEKSLEDWYRVLTSELTNNDDVRDRFLKDGICIPQNLIVVGTVNMDETTFSFSRKVLDRAMTIEMNEVNLHGGLTERYELIGKLGKAELIGEAVEGIDVYTDNKEVCDIVLNYLEEVNNVLENTPFKVAYRTRNEFLLYVVNNLPYNKDEEDNELTEKYIIARALDEITSMKVLSRIEGDDIKVSDAFLDKLSNTIKEKLEEIAGEEKEDIGSISLKKLEEMKAKLVLGHTSFWS